MSSKFGEAANSTKFGEATHSSKFGRSPSSALLPFFGGGLLEDLATQIREVGSIWLLADWKEPDTSPPPEEPSGSLSSGRNC